MKKKKKSLIKNVVDEFSIDSSLIFPLQNYVNTNNKVFELDKNIITIALAALRACDDFQALEISTKILPLFPVTPVGAGSTQLSSSPVSPKKEQVTSGSSSVIEKFISLVPTEMQSTVRDKLKAEDIDGENLQIMTPELWGMMGFKVGQIASLQKALDQLTKGAQLDKETEQFLTTLDQSVQTILRPALLSKGTTFSQLKSMSTSDFKNIGLSVGKAVEVASLLKKLN